MLAVSLSWIALYTFTPAGDRPYVDGSTDNSAFTMVFGYNGLERFGISVPGAVTSGPGVTSGGHRRHPARQRRRWPGSTPWLGGPAAAGGGFGTGWTKLLGSGYGPEIGWLYPLALLALVCGLCWTRRAERSDQVRGGFVLWGVWLLTVGLVFSKMSVIPHTAYLAALAAPLAALSAAGIVMFWRAYRADGWRGWMLPVAVAAELAWTLFLWRDYGGFLPWARDAIVVAGVIAIVVLVAAWLSHARPGPAGDGRAGRRRRRHAGGARRLGGLRPRHQVRRHLVERERRPGRGDGRRDVLGVIRGVGGPVSSPAQPVEAGAGGGSAGPGRRPVRLRRRRASAT